MSTATIESIRDHIADLIVAIQPTIASGVRFRQSQDEGDADFREFAEGAPAGAFRRFQAYDNGTDVTPSVSNATQSQLQVNIIILIAYPHDKKAGTQGGRDRYDCMDSDWRKINYKIGIYGRSNFSGTNDCTPISCTKAIENNNACDFLVINWTGLYLLDVTA